MKLILFQGDSITDAGRNKELPHAMGVGYANMVAGELGLSKPYEYMFRNRGISGNRVVDLFARMKKDMINLKPDVMSILIGVNDVWHEYTRQNGVEADRFERIYGMMIEDLQKALDFPYMAGEGPERPGSYYDPGRISTLEQIYALGDREEKIALENMAMPFRVQTVSMGLLRRHGEYIRGIADFMILKAQGKDEEALEKLEAFRVRFGAYETELERYFDHMLTFRQFRVIVDTATVIQEEAG